MSQARARNLSILALVVAGGSMAVADIASGEGVDVRRLIGVGTGGVMLTVLAELAPALAGPSAMLLMTVAVLYSAPKAITALTGGHNNES